MCKDFCPMYATAWHLPRTRNFSYFTKEELRNEGNKSTQRKEGTYGSSPAPGDFFRGGIFSGAFLTAYAAQVPVVEGCYLVEEAGALKAGCRFADYPQQGEYTLTLYLKKVEGGSEASVAFHEGAGTASGTGEMWLMAADPENGIYKVAVVIRRELSGVFTECGFVSSGCYLVTNTGAGILVKPYEEGRQGAFPEEDGSQEGERKETYGCPHTDGRRMEIVSSATPVEDQVAAEICNSCSEVLNYLTVPGSAYKAFLEEAVQTVKNAQQNETVRIWTDRWVSFDEGVTGAITERKDVTVQIDYRWKGKRYLLVIPAEETREIKTDENGFCGFRSLELYFPSEEVS